MRKPPPTLLALSFLILAPCALLLPGLLSGKFLFGYDALSLSLPFDAAVRRCLSAHEWPLWLNGVYGGMPGIASCNLLFVYPSDFAGYLCGLPFKDILGLDATLHLALAGVGMYLFLRSLERSVPASVLGAFFFAASGSELSQINGGYYNFVEGTAWLGWCFWAVVTARRRQSPAAWALCGGGLALQILAGAAQLFFYTLVALACFAFSDASGPRPAAPGPASAPGRRAVATATGLTLALALCFLVSAPQLWPTLQYLPLSARHGYTLAALNHGSLHPSEFLDWVAPGTFGWPGPSYHGSLGSCFTSEYFGLLPWALAAAALAGLWKREAAMRWMAGLALVAVFFGQSAWAPFLPFFQRLPILSGFRNWARVLFLVTFAVCALSAYGWDALRDARLQKSGLAGAALYGILALAGAFAAWKLARVSADAAAPAMPWLGGQVLQRADLLTAQARDSVRQAGMLLALGSAVLWLATRRLGTAPAVAFVLAFHCLDLSSVVTRTVRFVDPQSALEPFRFTATPPAVPDAEPWRVFDADSAGPNRALTAGYENLGGAESMPMRGFARTQDALRANPRGWPEWLDLMDVRYVFTHSEREAYASDDAVTVGENRGAFGRAWLVGRSFPEADEAEGYRVLSDPRFDPLREAALSAGPTLNGPAPRGAVRWLQRSPESFSLEVTTDEASALVVANFWYPSWKAAVDGQAAPLLKADGDLQAVLLSPGRHRVDFRFDPALFDAALVACLAGLVFVAALIRLDRRRPGNTRNPSAIGS